MIHGLLKIVKMTWPMLIIALISVALFLILDARNIKEAPPKKTTAEKVAGPAKEVPWSELQKTLQNPKIKSVALRQNGEADLLFKDGSLATASFPSEEVSSLAKQAKKSGAMVTIEPINPPEGSPPWLQLALAVLLVGGILAIFFYWQRGGDNAPKPKKKAELPRVKETFKDVAGCPEAVEEVQEFVFFLRQRERFLKLGAKMPSGAILHGPPGTGKTLLARALAGEAGVPFYTIAGSEAVNKYVGVGASTIRKLFAQARDSDTGAVIFIDEIDAIGRRRSSESEAASREHDNTLNQLLVELDGFSGREKIVVIGATNRIDTLDPALLRPGRLSRQIPVLTPDKKGRLEILKMYAKDKPLEGDVNLEALAEITSGSTGADLADMVNEAAIQAARAGREKITESDLREGHLRAIAGPERKSQTLDPKERERVAYHEAGHVLCAELSPEHEKAERVTIVARGQAAGLAVWGQKDKALHSPEYVHQRLIGILGGRAAERVRFGSVSSGAANDLQQANELARVAIEDWGISQKTGQLLSRSGHAVSDRTRSLVDQEVEEMVAEAFSDAVLLLEDNTDALSRLARTLLRDPVLERVDIVEAIGNLPSSKKTKERPGPSLLPVLGRPEAPKKKKRLVKTKAFFAEQALRQVARLRKKRPASSPE